MRSKRFLLCCVLYVLLVAPLVVSVDAASMWFRQYYGIGSCCGFSLVATSDGGFAIAGQIQPFEGGAFDLWLAKTNKYGGMEWNRTYGGTEDDYARSLVATSDGGYAIAGLTASYGAGYRDFWLVKTDASGNMQWNRTYGGTDWEWAWSLVATSDGGYAIAGYTSSFGGFSGGGFWFVKTDANGIMEWNKTYGGISDEARSLVATSDGGYAIAGQTNSFGGYGEFWLVKTDENGNMQWNRTYSGAGRDMAESLVETSDGGYAIAGYSESFETGTDWSYFWFVKTDEFGNMLWNKTYGEGTEMAWSLIEVADEGYVIGGQTTSIDSNGDSWLVKTDANGTMEWNQTCPGKCAYSLLETSDGGYVFTGAQGSTCCLVKTDEFGVVPEYTSWLVPTLVMTATAFIMVNRKRWKRGGAKATPST